MHKFLFPLVQREFPSRAILVGAPKLTLQQNINSDMDNLYHWHCFQTIYPLLLAIRQSHFPIVKCGKSSFRSDAFTPSMSTFSTPCYLLDHLDQIFVRINTHILFLPISVCHIIWHLPTSSLFFFPHFSFSVITNNLLRKCERNRPSNTKSANALSPPLRLPLFLPKFFACQKPTLINLF